MNQPLLTPVRTIDELIDRKKSIKSQMEKLNSELKNLREQENDIDLELLKKLDAEGLKKTANEVASVSIKEETVPDVHDWDALYAHIISSGDFSLIQRRVSSTAYRELLKLGENVPGLQPREIRRINFRSL
jgi:tRNA(Ile)-lysidine synthase TilS/MesJ